MFLFKKKIKVKTTNWLCRKKVAARFILRPGSFVPKLILEQQLPKSELYYTPATMYKSTRLILTLQ